MLTKALSTAVLGLSLAALPALAQNTTGATNPPANRPAATQPATTPPAASNKNQPHQTASQMNLWPTSKITGLNVYNQNNEKIGDINNLMMNKEGKIDTVVIGVGGFLGIGEHDVAVKYDQLKWVMEPVKSTRTSAATPAGSPSTRPAGTDGASSTTTTTTMTTSKQFWPDHAVMENATKDQLKQMPQFDPTK
jgi:sporulation protein YlmC with PRC-barrel domain